MSDQEEIESIIQAKTDFVMSTFSEVFNLGFPPLVRKRISETLAHDKVRIYGEVKLMEYIAFRTGGGTHSDWIGKEMIDFMTNGHYLNCYNAIKNVISLKQ